MGNKKVAGIGFCHSRVDPKGETMTGTKRGISRRDFLHASVAGAAGLLAAACVPVAPGGEMASAPAEVQRELTLIGGGGEMWENIYNYFTEHTGIKVNLQSYPTGGGDAVTQKFIMLGEIEYDDIDIQVHMDTTAAVYLQKGWFEDLSDLYSEEDKADMPSSIRNYNDTYGWGRHPFNLAAIVFYRNTNLVPEAPATWEEMVDVAQELTNADEEMWGWRSSGAGWAPNVTAVMVHQAGGNIDTMDDDASRAALQYMYDWVHTHGITPPTIVQEDPGAIRPHVAAGNVPMYWDMENGLGYTLGLDGNTMTKETLVASRWPAGPAGDNTLIMLGGIGIPKWNIKNKDEAFEFVRFYIQKEHAKQLCIFKNYTPARNSLYEDPDIREMVSIMDSGPGFAEIIRDGEFRCPYTCDVRAGAFEKVYGDVANRMWAGEMNVDEAWAWVQEELARVWGM
jgi:multiple sugar transport system substrate-binding protein